MSSTDVGGSLGIQSSVTDLPASSTFFSNCFRHCFQILGVQVLNDTTSSLGMSLSRASTEPHCSKFDRMPGITSSNLTCPMARVNQSESCEPFCMPGNWSRSEGSKQ